MDKKKLFLVVLLILVLSRTNVFGQELITENKSDSTNNRKEIRNVFIYTGIGLFEFFNIGIGYQVSPEIAFSFKYAGIWIGDASLFIVPPLGKGVGIKISYFPKQWIVNTISAEYISYLNLTLYEKINSVTKGNYFELNIGNENIDKSKLKIYWAIGFGLSAAKTVSTLFFPSLKVGINYNLF